MEISFTERELDIMSALWELGAGTVAEVLRLWLTGVTVCTAGVTKLWVV